MNTVIKTSIATLLIALFIAGCATQRDPYNDADSQRSRSSQTQDELSRDTK